MANTHDKKNDTNIYIIMKIMQSIGSLVRPTKDNYAELKWSIIRLALGSPSYMW